VGFALNEVVPWGRSFEEYRQMFHITDAELGRCIIGCGDGPASFNAELTRRGGRVISVDPLYRLSAEEIRARIDTTFPTVLAEVEANRGDFLWDEVGDPQTLGRRRMAAMDRFLEDYDAGRRAGRYLAAELPTFPFPDGRFDLALCSHLLFLYSDHLSLDLHRRAIQEMARVAHEVRIFPLLTLDGRPSPHLPSLVEELRMSGLRVTVKRVAYELQRGGNEMLCILV